ncbi:NAD(P)-dependent oxidoreductase [Gloeocapsa sp. PCC 73106]|uniref:NAD-dependent epimerase/dehydratase family protein n=1 Tax=Gloeocapsa sp. PCC 73106 TaxID=102232 RepID=UPI0002AD02CA|nr:NAD(P)-dependent oxidoreductase [Gloeocapsa sp. PCC 73106]ELR97346.1 nucleoside-diphosphate-sugar epimerase [Gloeocapsa sp. PCC 73106]
MQSALIGYTGFVGSNLAEQQLFTHYYNSHNIEAIVNQEFDLVVCAGVSGVKWLANQDPLKDWQNIQRLIDCLQTILTAKFVLISTVDVYYLPINVDEDTVIELEKLKPYGKHRRQLEIFVESTFNCLIIRLPGLFGKNLKKNIIYDLLNNNRVENINPDSLYQFYHLEDLTKDIEIGLDQRSSLINFATEPVTAREVAEHIFEKELKIQLDTDIARYDMRSKIWQNNQRGYLYNKQQILLKLKEFVAQYQQ